MEIESAVNKETEAVLHDQMLIEFRCPQCFKLYCTEADDVQSAQPQFECQVCHAEFAFDFPPENPKSVLTRSLSLPQVGKLAEVTVQSEAETQPELTVCPKCATPNPRPQAECYKCGVILAKAKQLTAGRPSLMRMWQELMQDYTNITKHMAFVNRCEDLQALPFALKRYQSLKEVQPQDSLATQMLNSVLVRSLSAQTRTWVAHPKFASTRELLKSIPWHNLLRSSPLAFGSVMILVGLLDRGHRNMLGGGVTLLVLTLGFVAFLKGRVAVSDFWRSKGT